MKPTSTACRTVWLILGAALVLPGAGWAGETAATWRISETPLGLFVDGDRATGKESLVTWVQDGRFLAVRYLQYRYPDRQAGVLVSCRRPFLTQCDPQQREASLLAGWDARYEAHHWYGGLGVALLHGGGRGGRQWGLPLALGYYHPLGDYFALGTDLVADINRSNSFAGLLFCLHYGKLR